MKKTEQYDEDEADFQHYLLSDVDDAVALESGDFLLVKIINKLKAKQIGVYDGDKWFTSIEYAVSTAGGSGYIIGGREHHTSPVNNAGYKPWMVKMDPSGTVIWSTLIQHYNTGTDPLEICDVVERLNTVANPNTYEYFGVAQTPDFSNNVDKMTVWKLDDLGSNSASPNDFQYSLNSLSLQWTYNPTQIEIIGTGAAGDGIQVFGTDQSSTPSNVHLLAGAYFNGRDGCESANDWTYHQGPGYSISPSLSTSNLSSCIYFTLTKVPNSVSPGNGCSIWANTKTGGSNARGAATGIENYSEKSKNVSIHPNPTNRNLTLSINGEVNGPVRITIINSLGQIEKRIEISNNVTNEFALDFEALQMNEGLYFVNVTVNKETHTNKVMFKK